METWETRGHIWSRGELSAKKQRLFELLLERTGISLPPIESIQPRLAPRLNRLSIEQERLWSQDHFASGGSSLCISVILQLAGPLNFSALSQAVNEIARRHDILRTYFTYEYGNPVQYVSPEATIYLPITDLSNRPAPEREGSAKRLALGYSKRPFDLSRSPMIRAGLIRLEEELHLLLLCSHRIVCDAPSMEILITELAFFYETFGNGTASSVARPAIQFSDYVWWQSQALEINGPDLLAGNRDPSEEPDGDCPGPSSGGIGSPQSLHPFESLSQMLPRRLVARLKELNERGAVSLYLSLLAAFNLLLHRFTGKREIAVKSFLTSRRHIALESVIGPFACAVVLRADLRGDPTFRDVFIRVKESLLSAYEGQGAGQESFARVLSQAPCAAPASVSDGVFAMQARRTFDIEAGGLWIKWEELKSETNDPVLTLDIEERGQDIFMRMQYGERSYQEEAIRQMLDCYVDLLEAVTTDPEWRISR